MKLLDWIPLEKLNWSWLSQNPGAIHLLEKNPEKIDWYWLSMNPNAIHLLEKNLDKICWGHISEITSAIHLLEQNPDRIVWRKLTCNKGAIHLLEKNQDKIDWISLSKNPSIFVEDFQEKSKERCDYLREELMEKTWHPRRFRSWCLDTEDEFHLEN